MVPPSLLPAHLARVVEDENALITPIPPPAAITTPLNIGWSTTRRSIDSTAVTIATGAVKGLASSCCRCFTKKRDASDDPRFELTDRILINNFGKVLPQYDIPKNPIVLAHGFLGFGEKHIPGLPVVQYWVGIAEALREKGVEVIITSVSMTGSIQHRAEQLLKEIEMKGSGRKVNIVAHSMGGLDARYMISRLKTGSVMVCVIPNCMPYSCHTSFFLL
jgi:hypothetical protein